MLVGGLFGAGLHRIIDIYVIGGMFRPMFSFVSYYSRVLQLRTLVRMGIIGPRQASILLKKLTEDYFLANQNGSQLPPVP